MTEAAKRRSGEPPPPFPVLVLTGPTGVGKTTVAFEILEQLVAAGIGHAMVDTDELDRIHPAPVGDPHKTQLTKRNLAAVWENLRSAGAERLVLTGVFVALEDELRWLREAVPGGEFSVVRLRASDDVLVERLGRRELGSGFTQHARRTVEQARAMDGEPEGDRLVVETTGRSVVDVAREVLDRARWLER